MTVPYGATLVGMADGLMEHLSAVPEEQRRKVAFDFAKAIVETLEALYPKVGEAARWITSTARKVAATGHDLAWTTPSGFFVSQRYRTRIMKRVRVRVADRLQVEVAVGQSTDTIEKRASATGSVPNVLQSLDAAHMHKVASRAAAANIPMASIHDCFAFHPNAADAMGRIIRETFIETHAKPFLGAIHAEAQRITGLELPPPPDRGDLDLREVLGNPFFFS